ncbi:MAG: hypothetical protein ACLP9S_04645 [Syntrophales bacterium]
MEIDALYDCVRVVNNTYRTASMNRKYYGYRLSSVRRINIVLEIAVAVGTSSAIAGWVIWKSTSVGELLWAILAGISTLIAVVKPIINLSRQIEKYTKLFIGHGDVYYELQTIVLDIMKMKDYSTQSDQAFKSALEKMKKFAADDDPKPNKKLLRKCYDEVNKEIPMDSLWWPTS